MSNFIENSKYRKAYTVVDDNGNFKLCKILNEYDNKEEANNDLLELLVKKLTEKDILKDYSKKAFFRRRGTYDKNRMD